jgi:lysozyme family protein
MAAPTFRQLKDEYWRLWQSMVVVPNKVPILNKIAHKLLASKDRYQSVSAKTGVPWAAIALIHQMECGGDWRLSIAQGDPWNKKSVHVPKGRGPFNSWEEAAIDALSIDGTDSVKQWGIERLCYELEKYNGFGSRNKGIHTPYLWSYSSHYTRGKYVADHVWDGNAVSQQAGAMPILSRLMVLDPSITFGTKAPIPDVEPVSKNDPPSSKGTVAARVVGGTVAAGTAASQVVSAITGPVTESVEQIKEVIDTGGQVVDVTKQVVQVAPSGFWSNTLAFVQSPKFLAASLVIVCVSWAVTYYLRRRRAL